MRVICHPDHKDEIEKMIELEHPESGIEVLVSKFLDTDQVLVYSGDYPLETPLRIRVHD